jgi:diguanylate cyclase (GGDEF)-like protein
MQTSRIRTLVSSLGLVAAVAIAVAVPAAYWGLGAADSAEALRFKARLSANHAARYIFAHDRLWQYQMVRLAEVIAFPDGNGNPVRQRITDTEGTVVVQESEDLSVPIQSIRMPVTVGTETVGWLDAEVSLRPLLVSTGNVAGASCLLGFLAWLTVRLLAVRALDLTLSRLAMESARFQAALDNMTQGLCLFDTNNQLVVYNRRFATMFGTPAAGASAKTLLSDRGLGVLFVPPDSARHDGQEGGTHDLEDGRVIQVERQTIEHEGWVATYEDITERRQSQERLSHMARHDALTGLPNRVLFREHMQRVLPRVRRGDSLAVLCLDLDGFKWVNDTLGHPAGDELLRQVARRLRDSARETDLIARLGGDEFAIIQIGAKQPADVEALAERLMAVVRAPFDIQGQRVEIATSVGAVLADPTSSSSDELLRNADIALYRAKAEGRGICRFFEPGMDADLLKRRQLEADLRRAIAEEQFEVFYQPLVEARRQVLVGFEALLRWRHPVRGLVSPADFIPVAEETGLIKAMGDWVLFRACTDAMAWPDHLKIAVNLSPVQFIKGRLAEEVERSLTLSGLAPHRLELEITESVLLQDNEATLGILHRLRDLGVRISMDDFGTGYSSLSYLRRFPFDKIKIDKSFVQNLQQGQGSIEIIRAVVGLGKALGMDVLAEGVETLQQLSILKGEGCDELQGYLFSKPRQVSDVPGIIAEFALDATAEAAD